MNPTTSYTDLTVLTDVLITAATAAARGAPSVLNTQPWRWRVQPDRLELFAEPSRQLSVTDPDGRLLMLSCGAILHHACVALAAKGWTAQVLRTPEISAIGPLAVLNGFEQITITPTARRQEQAMRSRHTTAGPSAISPLHLPSSAPSRLPRAAPPICRS